MGTRISHLVTIGVALAASTGARYVFPTQQLAERTSLYLRARFDERYDLGFGQRVVGLPERDEDGAPHEFPVHVGRTRP